MDRDGARARRRPRRRRHRGPSAAHRDRARERHRLAAAAQAFREEIRARVRDGQGTGEIRAYFVSRYGEGILLEPKRSGAAALVWVLPVLGGLVAVGALVATFRRWKRQREAAADPSA